MKRLSFLTLFAVAASAVFAQVSVPYGDGSGQVSFINSVKYPKIEEATPFGPLSFKLVGDNIWVANSIAGKLLCFNKQGKLVSEAAVMPDALKKLIPPGDKYPLLQILIEDMAPVFNSEGKLTSWWVTDSVKNEVINIDLKGKRLAVIKDKEFVQLFGIKCTASGYKFVSDKGAGEIFVFNEKNERVSALNWEWSDFAVDENNNIYRLFYDGEQQKSMLVFSNFLGEVICTTRVEIENALDPRLWWVNPETGEAVITYLANGEYKGEYDIARINADGTVAATGKIEAPIAINFFIDTIDYKNVWHCKANYSVAPKGTLDIVQFKMP